MALMTHHLSLVTLVSAPSDEMSSTRNLASWSTTINDTTGEGQTSWKMIFPNYREWPWLVFEKGKTFIFVGGNKVPIYIPLGITALVSIPPFYSIKQGFCGIYMWEIYRIKNSYHSDTAGSKTNI